MAKVKFEAEDFEKVLGQNILSDGDVQKDELKTLRVDLEWKGTDLDVCAFMLDSDGELATKDDIAKAIADSVKPMVMEAVKECLGIKDSKPSADGCELDSAISGKEKSNFDYASFLEA